MKIYAAMTKDSIFNNVLNIQNMVHITLVPLGCLSIDAIKWPCGRTRAFRRAAKTFPLARRNAQERAGDVVTLFQTVPGTCRPVHEVPFSRNAVITGHSTINVGQHLHAEINLSNASDIH